MPLLKSTARFLTRVKLVKYEIQKNNEHYLTWTILCQFQYLICIVYMFIV